jgi:hypothetical protein
MGQPIDSEELRTILYDASKVKELDSSLQASSVVLHQEQRGEGSAVATAGSTPMDVSG